MKEKSRLKEYLTREQVAERYSRDARTIDRWSMEEKYADLNFPLPRLIGRSPFWDPDDLDAWDRSHPKRQRRGATEAAE
jgi:hypothetical protein